MGQKIEVEGQLPPLNTVAATLKSQLQILDARQCWFASAYLCQAINALELEIDTPNPGLVEKSQMAERLARLLRE